MAHEQPTHGPGRPTRFLRLHIAFWLTSYVGATALAIPFTSTVLQLTVAQAARWMVVWTSIGAAFASAMLPFSVRLLDRWRGWRSIVLFAVASTAAAVMWAEIAGWLHGPLSPVGLPGHWELKQPPELGLCFFVIMLWSATVYAAFQSYRARDAQARALELRALAAEAELHALQCELNPHLLFNALNTIVGWIDVDHEKAKAIVRDLSDLLRQTLNAAGKPATVGSELRLAELYLAIQKARFEHRLEISWDIEPGVEPERMPAMVLQPLLENALKYGQASGGHALRVGVIVARHGEAVAIEVRNSGRLVPPRPGAVGLRNLRERLARMSYGAAPVVCLAAEGAEVVASVTLPRWLA